MTPPLVTGLSILLPAVGAVFVGLLGKRPNLREAATLITAGLLFGTVVSLFPVVAEGGRPALSLVEAAPGLVLAFEVEPLGLLFALVASFLWIVTSLYSIGYMQGHGEENQTRFYLFFALALSSAMGVLK